MSTSVKAMLLGFATLGLSACAAPPCPDENAGSLQSAEAEQAVRQIEEVDWARALQKHDVEWFEAHLADELVLTTGRTGRLTGKAEELAALKTHRPNGGNDKITDLRVKAYGDVAIATFHIDTTGTDENGPYHRLARYTEVWLNRDGRWQLVASHSSLVPDQAGA